MQVSTELNLYGGGRVVGDVLMNVEYLTDEGSGICYKINMLPITKAYLNLHL